jgi:hypothetical protein
VGRTFGAAIRIGCTLAACLIGACSSLPDLHFADGDGGVATDSGFEGGTPPACKTGTPEICNDGFDNDCNGAVDCQDLACRQQGFTCETVPAGWTAVSFAADARPSCPDGADTLDLKVASGDATAACMCSCNPVGGSCTSGSYVLSTANDGACSSAPATTSVPVDNAGCTPLGGGGLAVASHAMIAPPAGPTSCAVTGGMTAALTSGRICQPRSLGGGCGANQACAASQSQSGTLAACVTMAGKSACPAAFPHRSTAGTDATDSRTCSGCACGSPTACTGGSVSLYDSSMCKTNGGFQHADNITGTCGQVGPDSSFTAMFFKSTPPSGGGCGAPTSAGTVTGAVLFTNERTVCCK